MVCYPCTKHWLLKLKSALCLWFTMSNGQWGLTGAVIRFTEGKTSDRPTVIDYHLLYMFLFVQETSYKLGFHLQHWFCHILHAVSPFFSPHSLWLTFSFQSLCIHIHCHCFIVSVFTCDITHFLCTSVGFQCLHYSVGARDKPCVSWLVLPCLRHSSPSECVWTHKSYFRHLFSSLRLLTMMVLVLLCDATIPTFDNLWHHRRF